jgi:hypothetical protein
VAHGAPLVPLVISRLVSAKSISEAVALYISRPFGEEPEFVSIY